VTSKPVDAGSLAAVRSAGALPVEDYALIGDSHTVALVGLGDPHGDGQPLGGPPRRGGKPPEAHGTHPVTRLTLHHQRMQVECCNR